MFASVRVSVDREGEEGACAVEAADGGAPPAPLRRGHDRDREEGTTHTPATVLGLPLYKNHQYRNMVKQ